MRANQPLGVFDSGLGGLSVLKALRAELPAEDFIYYADTGHAPYGERGDDFVADRSLAIAARLFSEHDAKAIVVACNTATAAAIHLLREQYPDIPIIGVEPALKPAAALTRTGRVAVFATRGTLQSAKFAALQESLRDQAEFILQPCDGLAIAIEEGREDKIAALCDRYVREAGTFGSAQGMIDTLVFGCTHYPFASQQFAQATGSGVRQVETGVAVARQTRRVLETHGLVRQDGLGVVVFRTTGSQVALDAAAARWLPR